MKPVPKLNYEGKTYIQFGKLIFIPDNQDPKYVEELYQKMRKVVGQVISCCSKSSVPNSDGDFCVSSVILKHNDGNYHIIALLMTTEEIDEDLFHRLMKSKCLWMNEHGDHFKTDANIVKSRKEFNLWMCYWDRKVQDDIKK
jgi:hypothetical protein